MAQQARFLSSIIPFVVIMMFVSCGRQGADVANMRPPLPVPAVYNLSTDPLFSRSEDTLFYQSKKYSGYAYQLSKAKDTLLLFAYVNGLEEGYQKRWYPNKQLQEVRYYLGGKKNGTHIGYWDNGTKKFEFTIVDDYYEGSFKEWNKEGLLVKDFNYKHGLEWGSQKLWWNDGSVRANYVVKKGKKFGLIGLKICRNYETLQ